jgi:hypothetical protein
MGARGKDQALPLPQKLVVLADHDGAMRLSSGNTLRTQGRAPAMITPFKTKAHFLPFSFRKAATLRTVAARPDSGPCAWQY